MYAAILLGLALLATGCVSSEGSGAGQAPSVRPFSEVQASAFAFENDATFPGRGIFRVKTTEPMICAIAWGETESLGNFNNSLDMNGTGIVDHDVLLPRAEPGKTYFYRVQGSTAAGTLYQSDLATFTLPALDGQTPTGATPKPLGQNLALDATVTDVSSEFSATWAASNAIDGDLSTEWSTAGDGNDGFITIDLGSRRDVAGVAFLTRSMADGSATASTFWVEVGGGKRFGPFSAGNPADPNVIPVEFSGQVLRFEVEDSTGGNTGAVEIQVLAPKG